MLLLLLLLFLLFLLLLLCNFWAENSESDQIHRVESDPQRGCEPEPGFWIQDFFVCCCCCLLLLLLLFVVVVVAWFVVVFILDSGFLSTSRGVFGILVCVVDCFLVVFEIIIMLLLLLLLCFLCDYYS